MTVTLLVDAKCTLGEGIAWDARRGANDGRTDRAGNFVFGTLHGHPDRQRTGSFYQFSMGEGLRRLALGSAAISNSICFSPDGRTMYFCGSPDRRILQCDYDAETASVANVRTFVPGPPRALHHVIAPGHDRAGARGHPACRRRLQGGVAGFLRAR